MDFDRMGRRTFYKEEVNGVVTKHHRFVYDNYLCVQKLDALNNNAQISLFVWDPTEPVATRPLFTQRGTGYKFFYTCDGNKNVSEMVHFEQRNGIAAHYDYAPFGAVTRSVSASTITDNTFTTDNPFRFSSEYHDDTLGLVYYNYRHYNPVDGRWRGRDPIVSSLNLFLFASNNAITKIDVNGLKVIVPNPRIIRSEIDKGVEAAETIAPRVLASQALKLVDCPKGCKGYKLLNWNVKIEIIFYASVFRNNIFSKILGHEMHHFNAFKMCYNQIDEFWGSLFKGECEKESCTQAKIDLANAFATERYEFFRSFELVFDRLDYDFSSLSIPEARSVYNYLNEQMAVTEAAWKKASETLNEAQRKVKDECAN